jgi:trk system potassium uptake protein TrkA
VAKEKVMRIIIVGCGRLGSDLAYRLYQQGHEIVVVDIVAAAFNNLPSDFSGRMIEGDMLNQDAWVRAGADRADALAAVTNLDTLNAVIAHVAKKIYSMTNVVVRNYEPHYSALHEIFGVQFVSSTLWGSQRMEELINHVDARSVFSAGNGEVEVYELVVPQAWNRHKLSELEIPGQSLVVALSRAGRAVLPAPDMKMEDCDVVHISATTNGINTLRQRLSEAVEA